MMVKHLYENKSLIVDCGYEAPPNPSLANKNRMQTIANSIVKFLEGTDISVYITNNDTDHYWLLPYIMFANNKLNVSRVFLNFDADNKVTKHVQKFFRDCQSDIINGSKVLKDDFINKLFCEDHTNLNTCLGNSCTVNSLFNHKAYKKTSKKGKNSKKGDLRTLYSNDISNPLLITYTINTDTYKFLFTGDASDATFSLLISTNDNFAKVFKNLSFITAPHHGSNVHGESVWIMACYANNSNPIVLVSAGSTTSKNHLPNNYIAALKESLISGNSISVFNLTFDGSYFTKARICSSNVHCTSSVTKDIPFMDFYIKDRGLILDIKNPSHTQLAAPIFKKFKQNCDS